MMVLPGFFTMSGRQARVTRMRPRKFDSTMASQSSSLPSATVSIPCAPPALLTNTSSLGVSSLIHSTHAFTLSVQATSSSWKWADAAPSFSHSAATASSRSMRRAPITIFAPSRAKCRAPSAPNPAEAPVMKTHLSLRDVFMRGPMMAAALPKVNFFSTGPMHLQ